MSDPPLSVFNQINMNELFALFKLANKYMVLSTVAIKSVQCISTKISKIPSHIRYAPA